jgi:hypothetical protein
MRHSFLSILRFAVHLIQSLRLKLIVDVFLHKNLLHVTDLHRVTRARTRVADRARTAQLTRMTLHAYHHLAILLLIIFRLRFTNAQDFSC